MRTGKKKGEIRQTHKGLEKKNSTSDSHTTVLALDQATREWIRVCRLPRPGMMGGLPPPSRSLILHLWDCMMIEPAWSATQVVVRVNQENSLKGWRVTSCQWHPWERGQRYNDFLFWSMANRHCYFQEGSFFCECKCWFHRRLSCSSMRKPFQKDKRVL